MKGALHRRLRQIRRIGPVPAARLACERAWRAAADSSGRFGACFRPTGLRTWGCEAPPQRLVPRLSLPQDGAEAAWFAHEFDLLGSGRRNLNLEPADPLEDLPEPWHGLHRRLAAQLPPGYRLIDWQRDAKSGHRWSARQWSKAIAYGDQPGVEIKWPWELSRLQHLPALAGRIATAAPEIRRRMEEEVRAQIIDFVMQNPPGFGVDWACPMDVGIRAANLSLAVDLARAAGARFDDEFLAMVSATLRDHGRFLTRNLEWGVVCSNHYLADVVGLLFVAAYLPADRESASWLAFAGREVGLQLRQQFHPDGTNFEASTCYHRLSAEMMVYGTALMLHLAAHRSDAVPGWCSVSPPRFHPPPGSPERPSMENAAGVRLPFDQSDRRRLAGMGLFTQALLRRDGTIPIIGDDDSGRFMRLGCGTEPCADLLDHAHLPAAVWALFDGAPPCGETAESVWLHEWVGKAALPRPPDLPEADAPFLAFPDFGLYVWKRGRFRLTLRCGQVGQNGNGGHAHSDQLAITLDVDGQAVIVDPGTGVYTPDPDTRNHFRSAAAHSTIVVPGREPNEWLPGPRGLFAMQDKSRARMIRAGLAGAEAQHDGYGPTVGCSVCAGEVAIEVRYGVSAALGGVFTQFVLAPGIEITIDGGACRMKIPGCAQPVTMTATGGSFWSQPAQVSPNYGNIRHATAICWPVSGQNAAILFQGNCNERDV